MELLIALIAGLIVGAGITAVLLRSRIADAHTRGRLEAETATLAERAALTERANLREAEQAELRSRIADQEYQLNELRDRAERLHAGLEAEKAAAAEKLVAAEKLSQEMITRFQALSAEALQSNNKSFLDLAQATLATFNESARGDLDKRQQAINELLNPIKTSLEKIDLQIQGAEQSRVATQSSLNEQIRMLAEAQGGLRSETANLVKALRAPQTRGRWGEVQLKRVAEMAGMVDHCDFFEQENTNTEEGRLRPDMIVRLPGGKNVVVDAKAPLAGYLEALEAQDPDQARLHMQTHARQVKDHLKMLGQKAYWEQFQPSPEFVVLFLPGEAFYSAALEADPTLIEYGVEQRVILATPTTLIAVLKAVAYGWKQEALAENAQKISALGKELFERLCVVADAWGDVGRHIDNSVKAYNKSVNSLESRLFVTARKFRELGVGNEGKELKELNQIESLPREAKVISIKE